jgi:hypothetical protein
MSEAKFISIVRQEAETLGQGLGNLILPPPIRLQHRNLKSYRPRPVFVPYIGFPPRGKDVSAT